IETANHLFVQSQLAQNIWKYFNYACGVSLLHQTVAARQALWWNYANKQTQMGLVRGNVPAFIFWEIWKSRCSYKYDSINIAAETVIHKVKGWLQHYAVHDSYKRECSFSDLISLQVLQIQRQKVKVKLLKFVEWLEITKFCKDHGWYPLEVEVEVEVDSKIIEQWYNLKTRVAPKFYFIWERIMQLGVEMGIKPGHNFREGNNSSDGMSKEGSKQITKQHWSTDELHIMSKKLFSLIKGVLLVLEDNLLVSYLKGKALVLHL
ncbi:hypothetical protein GIB67_042957, partial [Kingdonia uniflora]